MPDQAATNLERMVPRRKEVVAIANDKRGDHLSREILTA
jgi:hypothetical protein